MSDLVNKPPAKMSSRERDDLLKRGISFNPQPAPQPAPQPIPAQPQEPAQEVQVQPQQPEQPSEAPPSSHTTSTEPLPPQHGSDNDSGNNNDNEQSTPRGFVCEKCKWCDGFEPLQGDQQVCRVCKCDLIFHIDVIEEDDDDAEEFSSDEEDIWAAGGMQVESSSDQD
jgi:hypothetical protein